MTLDDLRKKLLSIPRPELVAKIKASTNTDAKALINELTNAYNAIQFAEFTRATRSTVIDTLIRPFGLGAIFFKDKRGGNVTTIHNAKQGTYANEEEVYSRNDYKFRQK